MNARIPLAAALLLTLSTSGSAQIANLPRCNADITSLVQQLSDRIGMAKSSPRYKSVNISYYRDLTKTVPKLYNANKVNGLTVEECEGATALLQEGIAALNESMANAEANPAVADAKAIQQQQFQIQRCTAATESWSKDYTALLQAAANEGKLNRFQAIYFDANTQRIPALLAEYKETGMTAKNCDQLIAKGATYYDELRNLMTAIEKRSQSVSVTPGAVSTREIQRCDQAFEQWIPEFTSLLQNAKEQKKLNPVANGMYSARVQQLKNGYESQKAKGLTQTECTQTINAMNKSTKDLKAALGIR